jgi:hypothetical protein
MTHVRQIGAASWVLLVALLADAVSGAIFRHSAADASSAEAVGIAAKKGARKTIKKEDAHHRLAGLVDIDKDLELDKKQDDSRIHDFDAQIVALVHKRDAAKADEARKVRELAFLHMEIRREGTNAGEGAATGTDAAQENEQVSQQDAKADTSVDAAIAVADQVVSQAESDNTAQAAQQAQAAQSAEAAEKARQAEAAKAAAAAKAQAEAQAEREARIRAEAEAAAEAKLRAEAAAAKRKAEIEAEAEARMRAEAEAKAREKIKAEEAVKRQAEDARRAAEDARRKTEEEDQKKKEALADSADDSFKQFMKEEDGEDQMGDSDYEDSANALAGAIGWDRKEIETKANSAVKQLTEAIGGKKVVQSLQGMMAGIHR